MQVPNKFVVPLAFALALVACPLMAQEFPRGTPSVPHPILTVSAPASRYRAMPRQYTMAHREGTNAIRLKRFLNDQRVGPLSEDVVDGLKQAMQLCDEGSFAVVAYAIQRDQEVRALAWRLLFDAAFDSATPIGGAKAEIAEIREVVAVPTPTDATIELALALSLRNPREWKAAEVDSEGFRQLGWFDSLQEETQLDDSALVAVLKPLRAAMLEDNPQAVGPRSNQLRDARRATAKQLLTPEEYFVFLEVLGEFNPGFERFIEDPAVLKLLQQLPLDETGRSRIDELLENSAQTGDVRYHELVQILDFDSVEKLHGAMNATQRRAEAQQRREAEDARRKRAQASRKAKPDASPKPQS